MPHTKLTGKIPEPIEFSSVNIYAFKTIWSTLKLLIFNSIPRWVSLCSLYPPLLLYFFPHKSQLNVFRGSPSAGMNNYKHEYVYYVRSQAFNCQYAKTYANEKFCVFLNNYYMHTVCRICHKSTFLQPRLLKIGMRLYSPGRFPR